LRGIPAIATFLLLISTAAAAVNLEPVIVVYAGGVPELGEMLASLIESDARLNDQVMIVHTPEEVVLAAVMPATQCIVIYANHKDYVFGLESALVPFFREGGGLVGIAEVCYEPSALKLATEVFPVFANRTDREVKMGERRTRTYILEGASEVAAGLSDSFQILSMGTYLSADGNGSHVRVPGNYTVVYRDNATGCPLLVTHESSGGGRSVAFPGIMLATVARLDVYYGNLVLDENFVRLFTNSVAWASGNARIKRVKEGLAQAIDEYEGQLRQLKGEADRARQDRTNRRTATLLILWAAGLVSSGLVVKRARLKE